MLRIHRPAPNQLGLALTALAAMLLVAAPMAAESHAEGSVAAEIKALIMEDNAYTRENLMDREGGVSKDGSLEFWSSGGLLQKTAADEPPSQYEAFAITPKHIQVVELPGGEAAVAMYYSEGSMHPKGSSPVGHYMTRVTQVYVKEDGKWVIRAAHWSPVAAGSGTSQTSLD
ncbi:MAG: nuclear transport factor 2 family protein [Acidobacteria bacterium]|nr:MAG: nuclear transport factor 2 family protein [Acidobacteriota bacterium]REK03254.1 MAG: nuclear transport factor 2 family protein [Acidobacteriota bacterium]